MRFKARSPGRRRMSGFAGSARFRSSSAEDMTTILMIQRAPAPAGLPILFDFWTAAYQAIDD